MKQRLVIFSALTLIVASGYFLRSSSKLEQQNEALLPSESASPTAAEVSISPTTDPNGYTLEYQYLYAAKPVTDPATHKALSASAVMARDCESHFQSNVGETECAAVMLDRAAAEREWKVDELRAYGMPASRVGKWWAIIPLTSETDSLLWHQNFERLRSQYCEELNQDSSMGSSHPQEVFKCELGLELSAINHLNAVYYDYIRTADAFADPPFEPTPEDITRMTATNKTDRGCIWAGETHCNNY